MKILYKERSDTKNDGILMKFGIEQCYLKRISLSSDERYVTKKAHSHTGYEIHIITEGGQIYEIDGKIYEVKSGGFLYIPPRFQHRIISSEKDTLKYSLVFSLSCDAKTAFSEIYALPVCKLFKFDIGNSLDFVYSEFLSCRGISSFLIENRIFEILITLFREIGFDEGEGLKKDTEKNDKLELAKRYINDNIENSLNVSDVSAYCYLGEKQLSRLFQRYEGKSVGTYIRARKIKHIEKLLEDEKLSLKEISLRMNFNNEYYFNAFFKKYYGMPPGEFRNTLSTEK